MNKCLVIGGGIAGLTASAYLANKGFSVELIEASPKLGGRAYSFLHKESNTYLDNGQHLMMGCYRETLKFLSLIHATEMIEIQENLSVNFLSEDFQIHSLNSNRFFYPLNLLNVILNYSAVSFSERLSIIRFFFKIPFLAQHDLEKLSVEKLLIREKQNENVRKAFWEIICVGALNTSLHKASAKIFTSVLKEIFLKGKHGSKIILPKASLNEIFCMPAIKFIESNNGRIFLSERANNFIIERNKIIEVVTNRRSIKNLNFVVCTVPAFSLKSILKNSRIIDQLSSQCYRHSEEFFNDSFEPEYSSILNVHIWLKKNRYSNKFFALIGSKIHWVFSHNTYITCVTSDANELMKYDNKQIMEIIYSELKRYLRIKKEDVTSYLVIKEKRATFIPSNEALNHRPSTSTSIKNLFLAGDWVNTGLPSTIESAVKSGRMAAEILLQKRQLS